MKRLLEGLLRDALSAAVGAGDLRVEVPESIQLEEPSDPAFGDLASNVAMTLARQAGKPPRAIAQSILGHLKDPDGLLAGTEIAGPGFINLRASAACWRSFLAERLEWCRERKLKIPALAFERPLIVLDVEIGWLEQVVRDYVANGAPANEWSQYVYREPPAADVSKVENNRRKR